MVTTSAISSNGSMKEIWAQMYSKMYSAYTDGTKGLSQSELSSINTSGNQGGTDFLQSLTNQFDSLDSNKDGKLTLDEISQDKISQSQNAPMGPPPGLSIDSSDSDSSTTTDTSNTTSSTSSSNSYSSLINSISKNIMSSLDVNQDGKVTEDEIQKVLGGGASNDSSTASAVTGTDTSSASSDTSTVASTSTENSAKPSFGEELKNLSENFLQKLIDSYNKTGGSGFASALTSMV